MTTKDEQKITDKAVANLVETGREKFALLFAQTGQAFDDMVWNVGHLQKRLTASENLRLYFTYYGTLDRPLPGGYAQVIKSWLLMSDISARSMEHGLSAARDFWPVLQRRRAQEAVPFRWQTLGEEDLRQTELRMQERFSRATVYGRMVMLLQLARFLDERKICRPLFYCVQTPCPSKAVCTVAAQKTRLRKLPSKRALEGLADVYNLLAKTPQDRLRAAAIAILAVTGFRVGELLALPVDCEVEEVRHGHKAYGLRYFSEKAKLPEEMYAVRWLTPLQAELARGAIKEIRSITEPARRQAKILEENDPHIPIPGFAPADRMKPTDIQHFLGMPRSDQVHNSISRERLPRYGREKAYYFVASEFERYLRGRRVKYLWTLDKGDGSYQMLSESLFVIFQNFFFPRGGHVTLLAEPLRRSHINSFLSSHGLNKSVFERFDIREEEGAICRMSSHQFRHWLNDIADKGGLPTDVLMRWMGRNDRRSVEVYKHATMDERLQWVKEGIRAEQMQGTMAAAYFELPETEREIFLDGQIQAVHFTPMGLCLHDFAIEPCPYHLNCVRGCPNYLRTKGSQQERRHLLQIQENTEKALANARQYMMETSDEITRAWVEHHEETLRGIRLALTVDEEEAGLEGRLIHPSSPSADLVG
jgi:integrase